jgi:hypothetical protein
MNKKFLIMIATICGLAMVVALLLLPIATWGKDEYTGSGRAIEMPNGGLLLLFTWVATGFSALVFFKKLHVIGLTEERHMAVSFLGFKLVSFFLLAMLIAGPLRDGSYSIGYWLAFIASIVGTFAVYLTFNPVLAEKIAAAAKQEEKSDDSTA